MKGKAGPKPTTDPKELYVVGGLSLIDLARRLRGRKGCSLRQLKRRCSDERWVEEREAYVAKVAQESQRIAGENEAAIRARILQSYKALGGVATAALRKVHDRLVKAKALSAEDAASLKNVASALRIAHTGETELVDPKDERVSMILERAAALGADRLNEVDDWEGDAELRNLLAPRAMIDLSFRVTDKAAGLTEDEAEDGDHRNGDA